MSAWKVGFAKCPVNPPPHVALAGYGLKPERRAASVLDDIYVRAFVLDDSERKAAMISVEIIGLSQSVADGAAARIEKETGIPRQAVMVAAIHNHSAPTAVFYRRWGEMDACYVRTVEDRIVQTTVAAAKEMKPAALGFAGVEVSGVAVNRVRKDGPVNHTLRVLGIRSEETRKLAGAAVNFSCHPVCMLPDSTFVSADYPGRLIRDLERAFPGMSAAFFQGAAGDINPAGVHKGVDFAQEHGRVLAAAARLILENMTFRTEGSLGYAQTDCELPLNWDDARREATAYLYEGRIRKNHEWLAQGGFLREWAEQILGVAASSPPDRVRCRVGALRMGETALVGLPGEIETMVAETVRAESPFAETWIVGYAGGDIGYITDPRDYEAETYEAVMSPKIYDLPPFKPEAWRVLADTARAALNGLNPRG